VEEKSFIIELNISVRELFSKTKKRRRFVSNSFNFEQVLVLVNKNEHAIHLLFPGLGTYTRQFDSPKNLCIYKKFFFIISITTKYKEKKGGSWFILVELKVDISY
jgi:hypothetical protein